MSKLKLLLTAKLSRKRYAKTVIELHLTKLTP